MKRLSIGLALIPLFFLTTVASPVPGRWEKVELLRPGAAIVVEMTHGDRIEGRYKALTPDTLSMSDVTGKPLALPRDAIAKVSAPRSEPDRFWTPTKVGAVLGFAIGAGIGFAAGDDGVFEDFTGAFSGAVLGGVGAAGGALAGYAVKKTRSRLEVLYTAA